LDSAPPGANPDSGTKIYKKDHRDETGSYTTVPKSTFCLHLRSYFYCVTNFVNFTYFNAHSLTVLAKTTLRRANCSANGNEAVTHPRLFPFHIMQGLDE
jgi:hypothetical protein